VWKRGLKPFVFIRVSSRVAMTAFVLGLNLADNSLDSGLASVPHERSSLRKIPAGLGSHNDEVTRLLDVSSSSLLLCLFRVSTHQFGSLENMSLHGLGELFVSRCGAKAEFLIKREQPGIVAVRS
jgi:hypothetical protein